MKRCRKCNTTKPASEFSKDRHRIDGLDNWCKSCHREFERTARAKQRQFKESLPCADCGKFFPHYVMEFDHTEGTRNIGFLNNFWTTNHKKLLQMMEEQKVDLVCANCHKIRTHERRYASV